jgi:hypothetical protein
MTTGRINQVTVLRARLESRTRQRVLGLAPCPRPEFSHRPIKVVPQASLGPRQTSLAGGLDCVTRARTRVPSPPISHASRTFPQSGGLESAPSVETTDERPHLERGLPERGGSPIGLAAD